MLWHQEGTRVLQALPEEEGYLHQRNVDSHLWAPAADVKTSQSSGLKEPLPAQLQAVPSAPPPPSLLSFRSVCGWPRGMAGARKHHTSTAQ